MTPANPDSASTQGYRPTRGDLIVMVLCAMLLAGLYLGYWQASARSAEAVIMVNGKNWARLELFYNQDFEVPGPLGISHIQVRDGKVRFVDSPCPNKLCVHQGWITETGESATCLPNRISVRILATDPRFDTMSF